MAFASALSASERRRHMWGCGVAMASGWRGVEFRVHKQLDRRRGGTALSEAGLAGVAEKIGVGPPVVRVNIPDSVMVMKYAGEPLSKVRPCVCVKWEDYMACLMDVAHELLRRLHAEGLLHLDVHADNWVVRAPSCSRAGPAECLELWRRAIRGTLRLVDYGSAVKMGMGGEYHGPTRGGRWNAMAPEQFSPNGDFVKMGPGTDEFALAAMLVELTTGHAPFEIEGRASADMFLNHPRRLDARALAKWVRVECWGKMDAKTMASVLAMLRCGSAPFARAGARAPTKAKDKHRQGSKRARTSEGGTATSTETPASPSNPPGGGRRARSSPRE